jgi:hypothetical protein
VKKFLPIFLALSLLGFGCRSSVDTTNRSNSTQTTNVSEPDPAAQVEFAKLYEGEVDAPVWLFAVADDEGRVVLSAERNQGIDMAYFDPEDPNARLTWKTIVSKNEVGGVADHGHVFAHGYHYLVFSEPVADSAYVVKVDSDLNRVAMEHIVDRYELPASERPPVGGEFLITNDMFLVSEEDGIAAAFFLPTIGHKVFRMDEDLNVHDTVTIGGGQIVHGNGSSAIQTADGFDVLAADTIMHIQQSGVTLLRYDEDWEFEESIQLIDNDGESAGMTIGVYLSDGSLVMHARVNVDAYGRGEMPPPSTSGQLTDDGGNIARYVFDPTGSLVSTEYLYEGTKGHRPHTALVGDLLITTWDETDAGAMMRIDRVSQ